MEGGQDRASCLSSGIALEVYVRKSWNEKHFKGLKMTEAEPPMIRGSIASRTKVFRGLQRAIGEPAWPHLLGNVTPDV